MQKIILLLVFGISAKASFNSNSLGGKNLSRTSGKIETKAPTVKQSTNKRGIQPDELKNAKENIKKFKEELDGINLVLGSELPNNKRAVLHTKRAFALLNLARSIGINRKTLKEMTAQEKQYLLEAEKSCNEAIKLAEDKKELQATAYYLLGLAEFEFDQFDISQQHLINSIKQDSSRTQTGAIALMIAERYFETEKLKEAIYYYQTYKSKLTESQSALADYKTAWSYIGLGDYKSAEQFFVQVLRNKQDRSFFDESLRDLAFIATQHKSENEILDFTGRVFKSPNLRGKYLGTAIKFIINGELKISTQQLINEFFMVETNSVEKLQLLSLMLNRIKKDFADLSQLSILQKIETEIKNAKANFYLKEFELVGKDIEIEVENLIRVYSETYTGKLRLLPGLTKEKIAEGMVYLINWSLEHFSNSNKKPILYELMLDLCVDKKSLDCIEKLQPRLANEKNSLPNIKVVQSRLKIELLVRLDELFTLEPEKYKEKYLIQAKDFVNTEELNLKWLNVAKRLANYYLQKDQYTEAESLFEKIYNKEKNAENFYRMIFCYFKNKKLDKINKHSDLGRYNDQNITALKREIYLQTATENSQQGDLQKYLENIKLFLKSNPEPKKAALAYADLYNKFFDKNDLETFEKEWGTFSAEVGRQVELESIRLRAYAAFLKEGKVSVIGRFKSIHPANKDLNYVNAVAALIDASSAPELPELNILPIEKKLYLLGLLMLSEPERVIGYYNKNSLANEQEQHLLYLAYQMRDATETPQLNAVERQKLKSVLPIDQSESESALGNEIRKLKYPQSQKAVRYEKDIEYLVNKTKSFRKRSLTELAPLNDRTKIAALAILSANEFKMAEAIKNSPRPANLNNEESEEYTKGLNELADEYLQQGREFEKIKVTLEEKIKAAKLAKESNQMPVLNMTMWKWPEIKQKEIMLKLKDCRGGLCGLIYLDYHLNSKLISSDDYYKLKSGFLLTIRNSQIMRNYVQNELKSAKQEQLLAEWKRRVNEK